MLQRSKTIEEPVIILYFRDVKRGWQGLPHTDRGILPQDPLRVSSCVLQVLAHTPAIVDFVGVASNPHLGACKRRNDCLLCQLVLNLRSFESSPMVSQANFFNVLSGHIGAEHLADPQLLTDHILLKLHEDYLRTFWSMQLTTSCERTSPIYQIFGGLLKLTGTCQSCSEENSSFIPFMHLKVPIRGQSGLQSALYSERFLVENECFLLCDTCLTEIEDVRVTLQHPPAVLILFLERFEESGDLIRSTLPIYTKLNIFGNASYHPLSIIYSGSDRKGEQPYYTCTMCPGMYVTRFYETQFRRVNLGNFYTQDMFTQYSYVAFYEMEEVGIGSSSEYRVTSNTCESPVKFKINGAQSTPIKPAGQKPMQQAWTLSPLDNNSTLNYDSIVSNPRARATTHFESLGSDPNELAMTNFDSSHAKEQATTSTPKTSFGPTPKTPRIMSTHKSWTVSPLGSTHDSQSEETSFGPKRLVFEDEAVSTGPAPKAPPKLKKLKQNVKTRSKQNKQGRPTLCLGDCWNLKPKDFKFFTGLSQQHFSVLYKFLGGDKVFTKLKYKYAMDTPKKNEKKLKILLQDRLFLTLVRLRRGTPLRDLGFVMGISKSQIAEIFYATLRHMFLTFSSLKTQMFTTAAEQQKKKPKKFKPFRRLRCIIDGAEFRIQMPKDFGQQGNTFSPYKHYNTAHFIVGINVYGMCNYVSKAYEGSISDKEAVLQDDFLEMLEEGDQLMVDKGFYLTAETVEKGVELLRPPFVQESGHLTANEELITKAIATARIYVEHLVARIKRFRLIRYTIPNKMIPYLEDMVYVCAFLTNFDPKFQFS